MRKKSVWKTFVDFEEEVFAGLLFLSGSHSALMKPGDQSRAATMVFLQSYVTFERFVSTLIVAYINRAPAMFSGELQRRLRQSLVAREGVWLSAHVAVSLPKHLTVADVQAALDPDGKSITFASAAKLQQFAREMLSSHYAAPFLSLSHDDAQLLDAARSIRHFIAHGSDGARRVMNATLSELAPTGPNAGLRRAGNNVQSVGAYLRAQVGDGTRTDRYVRRFVEIALHLSS